MREQLLRHLAGTPAGSPTRTRSHRRWSSAVLRPPFWGWGRCEIHVIKHSGLPASHRLGTPAPGAVGSEILPDQQGSQVRLSSGLSPRQGDTVRQGRASSSPHKAGLPAPNSLRPQAPVSLHVACQHSRSPAQRKGGGSLNFPTREA